MNGTPRSLSVPAFDEIVADQRDVLNAFTVEFLEELFDLALAAFAFLVERDADFSVGRGQRLGRQAGIFALDVEEADFAEIEERFVIIRPIFHTPVVNVVCKVIDNVKTGTVGEFLDIRQIFEVDVVDRQALAVVIGIAVDQIDDRPADAADRGNAQLHRPGLDLHRLRPAGEQFVISLLRIADAETHATGRGSMLAREEPGGAARFVIKDQVDPALAPQVHILRSVRGDMGEAHRFEHRLDRALFRSAEFDEFEAVTFKRSGISVLGT